MTDREVATDRGAGTVLVLALVAVLGALALVLAAAGAVATAHRTAASAADLAALAAAAAAQRGAEPCPPAARIAARNGAALVDCRPWTSGVVDVTVQVAVGPVGPIGPGLRATGTARAGPLGAGVTRP